MAATVDFKKLEKLVRSKGDLGAITTLLTKNPGLMHTTSLAITAAEVGNIAVLDYILKNRTNQQTVTQSQFLNFPSTSWSALHIAVKNNQLETVKFLLENGADIDARRLRGNTALHIAVENGHKELIALLVSKGADLNLKNSKSQRAHEMHLENNAPNYMTELVHKFLGAIKENDTKLINEFIVNNKSWLTLPLRMQGSTVLHEALVRGNFSLFEDVLEKLCEHYPQTSKLDLIKNSAGNADWSALHYAVQSGNLKLIEDLLNEGFDINVKTKMEGFTPLHIAAKGRNPEVIELLIERGADLSIKSSGSVHNDQRMAHELCINTNVNNYFIAIKKELKEAFVSESLTKFKQVKGAYNPSVFLMSLDNNGTSALHKAILNGKLEYVKYMLNELSKYKNVDIKTFIQSDSSLLSSAIKSSSSEVLKYLIEQGVEIRTKKHSNLLHDAVLAGNKEIIETLVTNGAVLNKAFHYNNQNIMVYQIAKINDPNFKNHLADLTRSFRDAIEKGDVPTIETHLKQNPSWLTLPMEGGTILHIAARNNNVKLIEFLIKYIKDNPKSSEARIYWQDSTALTPFDYLAFHGQKAYYDELLDIRNTANLRQPKPRRLTTTYDDGYTKVINALRLTKGKLLTDLTKLNPAYMLNKDVKKFLISQNSKTQASVLLETIKGNNVIFDYVINDTNLRKMLHHTAHKNPNFVADLITALPIQKLEDHEFDLKKLMAESMYAQRNVSKKLKHFFKRTPFDIEKYSQKFLDSYINNYGDSSDLANLLKAKLCQGLFNYGNDIDAAMTFYEKISKTDVLKYLEARYELANFYIGTQQTAKAKVALKDLVDTAQQALLGDPNSLFLKNMIVDVKRLSSILDKTLGDMMATAKLDQAVQTATEALSTLYATVKEDKVFIKDFKAVKQSESRYCTWKHESVAEKTENPEPSITPENTAPKPVK